ncbi:MAG: hypothetical protein RIC16_12990 [Rhodospirillales bacterium]
MSSVDANKSPKGMMPSPLKDEPWPRSEQEELELQLFLLRDLFLQDSTSAYYALEVTLRIAALFWDRGQDLPDNILVPGWAVDVIAAGLAKYKEDYRTGESASFGKSFGVEAKGRGGQPAVAKADKMIRDIRICTRVAIAKEAGTKLDAVFTEIGEELELNWKTVQDIWLAHADHARDALKRFRDQQTRKRS